MSSLKPCKKHISIASSSVEGFSYGPLLWAPLILLGPVLWAAVLYVVHSWYVLGTKLGARRGACRNILGFRNVPNPCVWKIPASGFLPFFLRMIWGLLMLCFLLISYTVQGCRLAGSGQVLIKLEHLLRRLHNVENPARSIDMAT